jgi:hypothetical protein
MTPAVTRVRRTVFGVLAAGAACATLAIPAASADPEDTPSPGPAATDDCNAATLATTISSVTSQLSTYFCGPFRRQSGADRRHAAAGLHRGGSVR